MATTIEIVAAASHYAFEQTHSSYKGDIEGVSLAGPLGGIVVWEDGSTEAPVKTIDDEWDPLFSGLLPENEEYLIKAKQQATDWLEKACSV